MRADPVTPAFIIGAGHSGTTIVYRMLSWHPDAAWLSQYSSYVAVTGGPLGPIAGAAERAMRRVVAHSWEKSGYPWLRRLAPVPVEGLRVWRAVFDDRLSSEQIIGRLRRVLGEQARWQGARVFLAKPPGRYRSRCAPLVSAAFSAARYVHVIRDGRAVALSVLEKMRQSARRRHDEDLVQRAARHWIMALEQIESYAPSVPVHEVRYEALCDDVHGQLRAALEFAGLPIERFPFERCPRVLRSTNASRLDAAQPDDLSALETSLAPYLRAYRYAVPASPAARP